MELGAARVPAGLGLAVRGVGITRHGAGSDAAWAPGVSRSSVWPGLRAAALWCVHSVAAVVFPDFLPLWAPGAQGRISSLTYPSTPLPETL